MKKRLCIISMILTLLLFTSCATTTADRSLLAADGMRLSRKLPYLENLNKGNTGINAIEERDGAYTIWEREIRKNIIEQEGEERGYIEIVEIFRNTKPNFMKTRENLELEYEIRIYNHEERIIWSKSYYRSTSFALPFFPPKNNPIELKNTEVKAMKSIIEEFKKDINLDYDYIVSEL